MVVVAGVAIEIVRVESAIRFYEQHSIVDQEEEGMNRELAVVVVQKSS